MAAAVRSNFAGRNLYHEKARPLVAAQFEERAFEVFDHGAEFAPGLSDAMQSQDDRCSIMLRFRPDLVTVVPKYRTVLCELKAPRPRGMRNEWDDLLIEARAYKALCEWNSGGTVAMLAYLFFDNDETLASWLSTVPTPGVIFVPQRWDWKTQWQSMERMFPGVRLQAKPTNGGSGTPYIKVSKRYFMPLGEFIDRELLDFCGDDA